MPNRTNQLFLSSTMLANVYEILDQNAGSAPNGTGLKIDQHPLYGYYHLEATFYGKDDAGNDFSFSPVVINSFRLMQDFHNSYMDDLELSVAFRAEQLLTLLYNSTNIRVNVSFWRMSSKGGDIEGQTLEPVSDRETPVLEYAGYLALFKSKSDLLKKYPRDTLVPSDPVSYDMSHQDTLFDNIKFQLVTQLERALKTRQFSFMLRDAKMQDIILLMLQRAEIKKVSLAGLDNRTSYNNFFFPPLQTFATAMEFLQAYYGVYNKGLGYYYTRDVMYVFPLYETKPELPKAPEGVTHFYYVGEDTYNGLEYYHGYETIDDKHANLHVVVNTKLTLVDMLQTGIEHNGELILAINNDRLPDFWAYQAEVPNQARSEYKTLGQGPLQVIRDANTQLLLLGDENQRPGEPDQELRTEVVYSNNNHYRIEERIHQYRRIIVNFVWHNAVPYSLKPGHRVFYHYDDDVESNFMTSDSSGSTGVYSTKSGSVMAVSYEFVRAAKHGADLIYQCNADITLEVETNPAPPEQSTTQQSLTNDSRSTKEYAYGGNNTASLAQTTSSGSTTDATVTEPSIFK